MIGRYVARCTLLQVEWLRARSSSRNCAGLLASFVSRTESFFSSVRVVLELFSRVYPRLACGKIGQKSTVDCAAGSRWYLAARSAILSSHEAFRVANGSRDIKRYSQSAPGEPLLLHRGQQRRRMFAFGRPSLLFVLFTLSPPLSPGTAKRSARS